MMERFQEETTAGFAGNAARSSRLNRDEDGYFDNAAITVCENCGRTNLPLFESDGLLVCEECAGEQDRVHQTAAKLVTAESVCQERRVIVESSGTVNEMVNRLKAHDMAQCVYCASTRATVAEDRLHVDSTATCCELPEVA